ncbi:hypothetical protein D1814_07680 [Alteromonas sp. BL110]|uniref:hypothetical protein n=1 Tax=Alteromonas sp. BL110 TaxID=1714845 RepID=UPI000E50E61C|nr:hypothetical protein [Alteromonas sp. BL110]AXT38557.1 hypothetical protein D1814_07680 [Alteromonas sp. BL110]RKM83293.1 hypothetical protein D7031_04775 [Alteromonas sp. BL110]
MKLNPYSNAHNGVFIGLYPFLLVVVLLVIHYFSGVLALDNNGSVREQRDFNSAIGMTLLSGYFCLCLQLNHKNVLSTMISILVKTNQLSHLSQHRQKLFTKFQLHTINSLITAIFATVMYVIVENLLFSEVKLYQYVITGCAVLFWFLFFLFLIQSTSNVSYLKKHVLSQTENYIDYLNSLSSLARLSLTNATLSIGAFSLFPIFWINKNVPFLDIAMTLLVLCIIAFYLFYPVLKLHSQWLNGKNKKCKELNERVNKEMSSEKLVLSEQELEGINSLSINLYGVKDKIRFIACALLIAISWGIVLIFSPSFKMHL